MKSCSASKFFHLALVGLFLFAAQLITPQTAVATTKPEAVPETSGIVQHLNTQVDLNLPFTNAESKTAPLKDFFVSGRPAIIVPVYYDCPRLCAYTLQGVKKLIDDLDFRLGKDYRVIAVSIDPSETPKQAASRKSETVDGVKDAAAAAEGLEFLVGSAESVQSLMTQLGFNFQADGAEFSHTAGIMLITPAGKVSRYFFGIEFPAQDVRYAMIEAAYGRIGGLAEHIFLYCFRFDPTKGKYTLVVWNLMRAGCLAVVVGMVLLLISLKVKEKRASKRQVS